MLLLKHIHTRNFHEMLVESINEPINYNHPEPEKNTGGKNKKT